MNINEQAKYCKSLSLYHQGIITGALSRGCGFGRHIPVVVFRWGMVGKRNNVLALDS